MRPQSLPHPAWSNSPLSPWRNAQSKLDRHDHGHQHGCDHQDNEETPVNSLLGNILNPFFLLGSMIDQITSGLQRVSNDFDVTTESVNTDQSKIKGEEKEKEVDVESLDDIIRELFGIQEVYPIPTKQQFVTMDDLEEAINTDDENIIDAIKSNDSDMDEDEDEDKPSSTYETLNAIIDGYRKLDKHEKVERGDEENNDQPIIEAIKSNDINIAEDEDIPSSTYEALNAIINEYRKIDEHDKIQREDGENNEEKENEPEYNEVPINMGDFKLDHLYELVDRKIISNEV